MFLKNTLENLESSPYFKTPSFRCKEEEFLEFMLFNKMSDKIRKAFVRIGHNRCYPWNFYIYRNQRKRFERLENISDFFI